MCAVIRLLHLKKGEPMDKFRFTGEIEPTDKYEKARQDLLKARESFKKLNIEQQRNLIGELIQLEAIDKVFSNFQQ